MMVAGGGIEPTDTPIFSPGAKANYVAEMMTKTCATATWARIDGAFCRQAPQRRNQPFREAGIGKRRETD